MSSKLFVSPMLVAASLVATFAAAPVLAADYVQAPGSSLVFAASTTARCSPASSPASTQR